MAFQKCQRKRSSASTFGLGTSGLSMAKSTQLCETSHTLPVRHVVSLEWILCPSLIGRYGSSWLCCVFRLTRGCALLQSKAKSCALSHSSSSISHLLTFSNQKPIRILPLTQVSQLTLVFSHMTLTAGWRQSTG